jgi:hypothetical protein
MRAVFTFILLIAMFCLHAQQTRRIAHRFHSGDDSEHYDDNDGNYGIPMPHKPTKAIHVVIDSIQKDEGRIYYRWDTVDYTTPAGLHVSRHKRVARMRDLGNICTTLTTR